MVRATIELDCGEVVTFTASSVLQAAHFVSKNYYKHAVKIDIRPEEVEEEGGGPDG